MSNLIFKRIAKINPKFQKGKLFHRDSSNMNHLIPLFFVDFRVAPSKSSSDKNMPILISSKSNRYI